MGVKPSKHSSSQTEPCVPINHDEKVPSGSFRSFLETIQPPMPPAIHPPGLSAFGPYVPQVTFNIASANPFEEQRLIDEHKLAALATAISFARRVCLTPSAIITTGKILSLSRTKLAGHKALSTYKRNEDAEKYVTEWFERDVTLVFAREKVCKGPNGATECPAISPADDERSALIMCFLPLDIIAIEGRARESGGERSPIYIAQCVYMGFCLAHMYQRAMRRHYDHYINAIVTPSLNVLDQVWDLDGKVPSSNAEMTSDEREFGWHFEEEVIGGCVCTYDFNRITCNNHPVNLPVRILDNSTQMPFRYFCIDLNVLVELLHATSKRLETLLPLAQWRRDHHTHVITIERSGVRGPKVWRGPGEPWPTLTDQYVAPPPEEPNAWCGYPHEKALVAAAELAMEKRTANR